MGANNYLWVPGDRGGEYVVAFRWGCVRELEYRVGDNVDWRHRDRPKIADGIVRVGGFSRGDTVDGIYQGDEFYSITINTDVVCGFKRVSEPEYDSLVQQIEAHDGGL